MKIAVVTPIPTPYRDPFWNTVSQQDSVELHVYYCSAGKGDRPWKGEWSRDFRAEVLPGTNLLAWRGRDASCFWNPALVNCLDREHYDAVVIGGYNHLTMLAAIRYCLRRTTPYFLMCESHLRSPRHWIRTCAKDRFVRWVVRNSAGCFPTGILARDYLLHYGADANHLTFLPNVPDVEDISRRVELLRDNRDTLRAEHGLNGRPVVLFVGRLISKKNVDTLIRAFCQSQTSVQATLVIVGDGPLRSELGTLVNTLNLRTTVRFVGFVQPSEMPKYYAMADVFVLPSSETWGVVVLEALAAGLPTIVSDEVGCQPDVGIDPRICDVVPAKCEELLARAISRRTAVLIEPELVRRIWQPVAESLSYGGLAQGFVAAMGSRRQNDATEPVPIARISPRGVHSKTLL